jgi:phage-related protein
MITFKKLQSPNNIQELIKLTFDADLSLSGNWGYEEESATTIQALSKDMPLSQLEHMLVSIRTHLEMNITQEKEQRYGGINVNEKYREEYKNKACTFHKVTYEITAIQEELYTTFIKAYKEGYGKEDFDLTNHFEQRKKATLTRVVTYWFNISALI